MATPTFDCVLVGPANSGKTALLIRLTTGHFIEVYTPTPVDNPPSLVAFRSHPQVTFRVYDGFVPPRAECAIIVLDKATLTDPTQMQTYVSQVRASYGDIPLVVCGSKVDLLPNFGRSISRRLGDFIYTHCRVTYYDVSAKTNYNQDKPWLHLARVLTANPELTL